MEFVIEDKDKSAIARQTPQQTNKELPDATQDEGLCISVSLELSPQGLFHQICLVAVSSSQLPLWSDKTFA